MKKEKKSESFVSFSGQNFTSSPTDLNKFIWQVVPDIMCA